MTRAVDICRCLRGVSLATGPRRVLALFAGSLVGVCGPFRVLAVRVALRCWSGAWAVGGLLPVDFVVVVVVQAAVGVLVGMQPDGQDEAADDGH